jgi:hypothetical protein
LLEVLDECRRRWEIHSPGGCYYLIDCCERLRCLGTIS